VAAAIGWLLLPAAAWAQSGAIAGTVKDSTGAVLPGVTVEVASPALIEKARSALTDAQGQYRVEDLRPGSYSVTFTLTGFTSVKREGLELNAGVTLPVNADLQIGGLQETLTVSGASPVVDVQNSKTQVVLTRQVLDSIPTPMNNASLAQITVGVYQTSGQSADVGGITGDTYAGIATHGGADGMTFQDGMRTTTSTNFVTNSRYQPNQFSVQEMVLDTGGISAENLSGGVNINVVQKEGGNRFSGMFGADYANSHMQSDNLTPDLRARGLANTSSLIRVHDVGVGFGGPLVKSRLWFYTAHRNWGGLSTSAGVYSNLTQNTVFYTPNFNAPGQNSDYTRDDNGHLTWQMTSTMKLSGFVGFQDYCLCPLSYPSQAPESSYGYRFHPNNLVQAFWSYAASSRLLFQAGYTNRDEHHIVEKLPGTGDAVSVMDVGTGITYGSHWSSSTTTRDAYGDHGQQGQNSMRASMAYVTGAHSFKAGLQLFLGQDNLGGTNFGNNQPYQYILNNGVPIGLNLSSYPFFVTARIRDTGIFVQDQWTMKRLTLNMGVRYDALTGYDPAQCRPAGIFTQAVCFDQVDKVPNWKDVNPRFGLAYDLFGNAKTALKVSVGRYSKPEATDITNRSAPSGAISSGTSRTWNPTAAEIQAMNATGQIVPNCNLANPAANGECGPYSNQLFGTLIPATRFATDVTQGFDVRQYNWQTAVSIQQELRPGMALTVGYFNTWWGNGGTDSYPGGGNDWVTNNLAVSAADYTPYCITAPVDPRLPNGGGYQVCGMYDVSPAKFGKVQNVVSNPADFGSRTYVYNGVDAAFNARFGHGGILYGGVSLGMKHANRCASPNVPSQFCEYTVPVQGLSQYKISVSYPLPYQINASAVYINTPGIPVSGVPPAAVATAASAAATWNAPNSAISPSLGRNLGACGTAVTCVATAPVDLIAPFTLFEDRLSKLDLRVSKDIRVGQLRVEPRLDLYNALNASTILSENTTFGSAFRRPLSILAGRFAKVGVQVSF
jgi:hypothetical protein